MILIDDSDSEGRHGVATYQRDSRGASLGFEARLCAADKQRGNMSKRTARPSTYFHESAKVIKSSGYK
ncbi:MAG: hypothetical protein IPK63_22940 [Candidatus Competibacteraceae bacterium]|nr:hypothetical protein [Candidatus Competibacteraceae bacterium]